MPGVGAVTAPVDETIETPDLPDRIADTARRLRRTVAVAESLTGGMLSSRLAAAPDASEWFRGGVVAYATGVKHEVLGVPPGPVVSEEASLAMSLGVARLLNADVSVAVTGVGGPGRQDDQPPGTVWIAVYRSGRCEARRHNIDGDTPAAICEAACRLAQRALLEAITDTGQ